MTLEEFDALQDGDAVWFSPPYFAFPMPATVRVKNGRRGLWVNFFGDGQCLFTPQDGREGKFAKWVASGNCGQKTLAEMTRRLRNETIR